VQEDGVKRVDQVGEQVVAESQGKSRRLRSEVCEKMSIIGLNIAFANIPKTIRNFLRTSRELVHFFVTNIHQRP
jgi:hypothetical protein